ncbi:hypothetical protein NDU88_002430 [Pleurodeles waltl]|uniref:Uncharacterized protein n=1 Tax=Pleurodeles waltl TaxID=8319 RepID=A0AAV7WL80_PLEWA|nr:hypothetical protein NDU88_002430 [Pleurodeles waltl]
MSSPRGDPAVKPESVDRTIALVGVSQARLLFWRMAERNEAEGVDLRPAASVGLNHQARHRIGQGVPCMFSRLGHSVLLAASKEALRAPQSTSVVGVHSVLFRNAEVHMM